jgi:hypothetical protein
LGVAEREKPSAMDARAERVGRNEALFREVNEQVESLNRRFSAAVGDTMDIVCECADLACIERLTVPLPTYERVRSEPTLFLVKPGHEQGDFEEVVAETPGFNVVRKDAPDARRVAVATDPRSD